jgi:hypothetical protein
LDRPSSRRPRARSVARRDYQLREYAQISVLERRSRGLRLYAAWIRKEKTISIREAPKRGQLPQVIAGAFHDNMKAAA